MFRLVRGAVDQPRADIAAEQEARVAADPGNHRLGQRPDPGDGGDPEHEAGQENAKTANAAAQLAPRQPEGIPRGIKIPSPPFRGEREGPIAERWEGEVGAGAALWNPPPHPALSAPRGGEGEKSGA